MKKYASLPLKVLLFFVSIFYLISCTPDSDFINEYDSGIPAEDVEQLKDNSDNSINSGSQNIDSTIVNTPGANQDAKSPSSQILYLKNLFDSQSTDGARQLALSTSGNNGDLYYFDVSAYVYMFQVTGEDQYMDFAVRLYQNIVDNSVIASSVYNSSYTNSFNDNYSTWICPPGNDGAITGQCQGLTGEIPLNEGRGMRTVARMLWVISNSPTYRAKGNNQDIFMRQLEWFEKNNWEKWETRGLGNIYRSHTHMASHYAQIGWFLHGITGKQKYREVYENISYAGFPTSRDRGANMRNNLREINLKDGNGYVWNGRWFTMTGSNDVSHANSEVELMVLGAEMSDYWSIDDMSKLIRTFDQLIFKDNSWDNHAYYVDGSGNFPSLWNEGWVQLGRFSQSLQNRLAEKELIPTYYYQQRLWIANLAYNQAYLEGNLIYPEN